MFKNDITMAIMRRDNWQMRSLKDTKIIIEKQTRIQLVADLSKLRAN